jgi:drug/metabolite transporter (DMT)-like permease
MVASLFAALAMLPFAWPLSPPGADLPVLLAMGVLQTGMGLVLLSQAIPRLSAGELGIIGLLEMVLAPVWVWLAIGEQPTHAALLGGVVVVGAVFANQIYALRAARAA